MNRARLSLVAFCAMFAIVAVHDAGAASESVYAQRRKALRSALAGWAGSPAAAEQALRAAGVDPMTRAERVDVTTFAAIAAHRP